MERVELLFWGGRFTDAGVQWQATRRRALWGDYKVGVATLRYGSEANSGRALGSTAPKAHGEQSYGATPSGVDGSTDGSLRM